VLNTGSLVLVAILVVTALILVNAVYVAAEFSAVSVRRARIQQMAADGHPLASWLLPVLQSPAARDRYIGACQIGITLSSLILGAYAQSTFAVWLTPYFATFLGESLDLYPPFFEPRTHQTQSTFDLFDPVRELFRTINSAPVDSFRDSVGARLDFESTLRLIAGEAFMAEWDGILGYAGMNNFYLYRPATSAPARILPWDADHTFQAPDYPLLAGAAENVLMRRILEDPVLRARYFQLVLEAVNAASSGDWLLNEVTKDYQQIRDSALADPFKPYTNEEFDAAFAYLLTFARTRPAFVTSQVQQNK